MRLIAIALLLVTVAACRPHYAETDQALLAQRTYLNEEVAAGRMTPAQAQAILARTEFDLNTQAQQRRTNSMMLLR